MKNSGKPTEKDILEMVRGFQPACVVIAGAELDVFTLLDARPMSAARLAARLKGDVRATTILLDALAALGLLAKQPGRPAVYGVQPAAAGVLSETGARCMLGMVRHLGACLRNWGTVVRGCAQRKAGRAPPRHTRGRRRPGLVHPGDARSFPADGRAAHQQPWPFEFHAPS